MAVHMLVFPSVSISLQLRSAGAAVIQELFPRVSSIATLDISDNGTVARCRTSNHDLDFLSLGSWGWSGLLMSSCVCVCVLTGLDADLLTVLPALSRHPSLKHLHLGKNFNIKNRCCQCSLSCFTAVIYGYTLCAWLRVYLSTNMLALHMPAWIYTFVLVVLFS